jgi:hypothetical protein
LAWLPARSPLVRRRKYEKSAVPTMARRRIKESTALRPGLRPDLATLSILIE